MPQLEELGWNPFFQAQWNDDHPAGCVPARVVTEHKDVYRIQMQTGEASACVSGRLRHDALSRADLPVVGDWVAIEHPAGSPKAIIHQVLPRHATISRTNAGRESSVQVLAVNVDTVLIVTAVNRDFSLRRLERFLTLVWDGGARPVVLLNKVDLCSEAGTLADAVRALAPALAVHAISALHATGLEQLEEYLGRGQTLALLGSSGVGKSTLLNQLAGCPVQEVREISEASDRGRQTTTARRLINLAGGALVIDTPGLREVQLWGDDSGVRKTFEDIEEIARNCRFRDCQHGSEPGCAVRNAVQSGRLDQARLDSYGKLLRELRHLMLKHDKAARSAETRKLRTLMKQFNRLAR